MTGSTGTGVGDTAVPEPLHAAAEPRWPMATAVLAATVLHVGMPHRGRVPGWWVFPVVQLVLLGLLVAQDPGHQRPARVETAPGRDEAPILILIGGCRCPGLR